MNLVASVHYVVGTGYCLLAHVMFCSTKEEDGH